MGEKEEKKDDKPAAPQPSTVVLRMKMHCMGCERKVKKSLAKLDGLLELKIEREEEKVTVKGFVDPKNVLKKALKTGKPAEFWPAPTPPPAKEEEAKKEEPKKEEKKVEEPKTEEPKKQEPPKEEPKKEEKKQEEAKKEEEPKKEEAKKDEPAKKEPEPKKNEEEPAKKGGEDKSEKELERQESVTLLNQPPMQFDTVRIIAPQYFSDDNPNACSVM